MPLTAAKLLEALAISNLPTQALSDENTESEARRLLRSLYYSLGDETNLKRIEAM